MSLSNKLTLFMSVLVLVACGGSGSNGGGSDDNVLPPQPEVGVVGDGNLAELVEWTRDAYSLPAMAVVLVKDGQLAEMAASGLRSIEHTERVSDDDLWHLGSLSKAITASLVGVLVDQSIISWDTTPLDVWPELDASIHPQFRDITIRQLLTHTTGLERINAVSSRYGDLAVGTVVEKRREFSAELLASTPIAPTGEVNYSNGGYIVVGAMLETIMSSSWESLVQQYVFAPLNMSESGFGAPKGDTDRGQPWGHWDSGSHFDPVPPWHDDADNPQIFGPAGTVHASLRDYANFMIAHLNGAQGIGGLLTKDTFARLHTPVTAGSAAGWGVSPSEVAPGFSRLGHAGSNLRWYSVVRLEPGVNAGALFVTNAGGQHAADAINVLQELVVQRVGNSN